MEHKGTVEIRTQRLLLRRLREDDAQAMFDTWANDEEVCRYMSWRPHGDVDETRGILAEWVKSYEKPDYYHWGIELDGKLIGSIGAFDGHEYYESISFGYCIAKAYWGQGIMTEALHALLDFLFNTVGYNRIHAIHYEENPASGRVMQKCGMTQEGVRRKGARLHDGRFVDCPVYSILRGEFR